jgi:hypothetical protein
MTALMLALDPEREVRLRRFGIPRAPQGDYADTVFRCPTHPDERAYLSVRPPELHDDSAAPYVSTHCYWCDAYRRLRGDRGFSADEPQSHAYPILEVPHE